MGLDIAPSARRSPQRRIFAVVAWAIAFVHIAANVEVWIQRKRAGLPFKFLP